MISFFRSGSEQQNIWKKIQFEQKPLLAVDSGKNKCSATLSYLKLTEYMIAPNKKEYLKKYDAELKEIENLRLEEEQNMA